MSGVFVLMHRDGAPVEPGVAGACMARLRQRAADGERMVELSRGSLGHAHSWTTPEESGEDQPLHDADAGLYLSFDGRLDNRDEIGRALGLAAPQTAGLSDARLVLAALAHWGLPALSRFIGPFALALVDERGRRVVLARDVLGDRGLVYHLDARRLVAASEEAAVLAHPAIDPALDERRLAAHFALRDAVDDATFYAEIRQVLPGHAVVVGETASRSFRFRTLGTASIPHLGRLSDAADAFREAVDVAVACRLRASGRVGVMTSGGLDSGPVLATAATLAAARHTTPPIAVSWVFDRFAECDERRYIDPLVDRYGLEAIQVVCDDALPLSRIDSWPLNPNTPSETPYRWMSERCYRAAAGSGCRVLLTGLLGDDLFLGAQRWLWSLLLAGRVGTAAAGAAAYAREYGSRRLLRRALFGPLVPEWLLRRRPPAPRPEWLTGEAGELLGGSGGSSGSEAPALGSARAATVASLGNADSIAHESFHGSRTGVDLRHPFRDVRLVELMLALPARHLYSGVETRPVVRRAMRNRLPAEVAGRRDKARYEPLLRAAIRSPAEGELFRRGLVAEEARWRRFVRPDWVARSLPDAGRESLHDLVLWKCTWFDNWARSLLI